MSKSNPNIYLEPDESKDSGDSTFENDFIQNEMLNSALHHPPAAQSPYNSSMIDEQLNNVYNKQNELRINEKLRKPLFNQTNVPSSNPYSAELPNINRSNLVNDHLYTADQQQKRSQSQPVFINERRSTSQHQFIQSENGLDINQYALVQNSSGSSILDYSVDDLTKTQSIVTNVYLNCNHARRLINPVRKRKMKLIKTYSSQRNLNYDLTDLEERVQLNNQFNSLGDLLKSDNDFKNDENSTENLFANNLKEMKANGQSAKDDEKNNLINELLDDNQNKLNDELLSAGSMSVTELKNLKSDSILNQQVKSNKPAKLNQLKEDSRKTKTDQNVNSGKQQEIKIDKETEDKKHICTEDNSNKTDSRCSHYLHYKQDARPTKYTNDFSHVKHKVDARNNIAFLKAQSNLLRSKSNLEDLALEELDEAGEIMQNAEKSLRK